MREGARRGGGGGVGGGYVFGKEKKGAARKERGPPRPRSGEKFKKLEYVDYKANPATSERKQSRDRRTLGREGGAARCRATEGKKGNKKSGVTREKRSDPING